MKFTKIIPLGSKVKVLNGFKGTIIKAQISISGQVMYLISRTSGDNYLESWIYSEEITTKIKEKSIINQCLEVIEDEE